MAYDDPYNPPHHAAAAAPSYEPNAYAGVPAYPSTEKFGAPDADVYAEKAEADDALPANTERAQRGRAGLQRPPSTWAQMGPPPRSTGILRMWRKDERGKQWSRGGPWRTGGRLVFCCGTIALLIIISVILAILLYVRPPNVVLNNISIGSDAVSTTTSGFSISISLGITVANPNWFDADFKEISADVRYPGNNTNIFGGGELYNVDFKGYTQSTFDFPLALNYSSSLDPDGTVLSDILTKCGLNGGTTEDLTIDYTLYLKLSILGVKISPSVSSSASFACPLTSSDLESIEGDT
ncbi:hypothetical protein Q5752_000739 [Cryptotrichosporon argae]